MFTWMLFPAAVGLANLERSATAAAAEVRLGGTWVSECLPIGENGRHGYIATITFARRHVEANVQLFARNTCDTPTLKVEYRGERLRLQSLGNRIALRQRSVSVTLVPQDESVVRIYNRPGGGCGLQDWRINVPKPVAGRDCGPFPFPTEGAALFDSIWVNGDGTISFAAFPVRWIGNADAVPAQPIPHSFRRAVP
jgi:hypothetical protein